MTYIIKEEKFIKLFGKEIISEKDISELLKSNTLKATRKYPKSEDLEKQTKDWIIFRLAQGLIIENDIQQSTNRRKASKQDKDK